jgi:hypothetical protein
MVRDITGALEGFAVAFVADARAKAEGLAEKAESYAAKALKAKELANAATKRLETYRPKLPTGLVCPYCSLKRGQLAYVNPVEHSRSSFQCEKCHKIFGDQSVGAEGGN